MFKIFPLGKSWPIVLYCYDMPSKLLFSLRLELQRDPRKVKNCVYLRNRSKNGNSKTTLWSKTLDFVYWGPFSTPNSDVFVQENFSNFLKILIFQKNMLLKKFSNAISRPVVLKNLTQPNFLAFFWSIILISGAKNFFQKVWNFQKIFYKIRYFLKINIWKNGFRFKSSQDRYSK